MSEASVAPSPVAPEAGGGFFQNLVDLYFAPREAFARIVRAPRFVLPLVGHFALIACFTGIWMSKVDAKEFTKTQIEESGRWDKIPPEQRQAILDGAEGRMRTFGWIGPVAGSIFTVLIAAVLMGVFRFFYASDVSFKQSLAVTFWTSFVVALVTTPLMLGVFALKGDWNIDPGSVLQANLGLLVEKSSTARPLWALLTSVDVFVLWMVFLLAVGFGVASRKSTSSALWGVVVPWLVFIVGVKVGLSAIF